MIATCRPLLLLVLVLALGGLATPLRAQGGSMAMSIFNDEGTFTPALTHADLDVFKRVLSMKPDEVKAMEDLYADYSNSLKTEGGSVRAFVAQKMEESELMADTRILKPAQDKLADWRKRSDQLKKSFMDDLKALLTRDQEARWPAVERELRRIKLLNGGRIPGEEVDLIKLTEDIPAEFKRSPTFPDLLERYSQDIDRAIVSRKSFLDEHEEKFSALIDSDPAEAKRLYDRASREREAIANINDQYLRLICAELPPDEAQKLRDRCFKLSYYVLAKGTRGERYVTAAGKLDGLTTEQRSQVDALLAEYDRQRRVIIGKMAEFIRDEKLTRLPDRLDRKLNPPTPRPLGAPDEDRNQNEWDRHLPPDHPMLKLRRARFDLDRDYRARIDAILTPEQRGKLPDQALEAVTFFDDSPWGL